MSLRTLRSVADTASEADGERQGRKVLVTFVIFLGQAQRSAVAEVERQPVRAALERRLHEIAAGRRVRPGERPRAGGRVRLIEGDRSNFKITSPEDLAFAAQLLEAAQ